MNSVELRGLVKRRGATLAVDQVSFTVRRGEFFSLLGPSGSGKTSTLRLIAGFDAPDAGDLLIDDRPMAGVPPNQRPVNVVFQQYALFPHLTVFGNVAFGLEMRRVPRGEIASRVREGLDMVRMAGKAARKPAELSGGEQQRVALARALVNRPSVVLLDEPLGALDRQLRHDMQLELKAIQAQAGATFIYVTHDQEEALTMSDRLAVMHAGRILQIGTPQEIYEQPATSDVARFVGLSNLLRARIAAVEGARCTLDAPGLPPIQARLRSDDRRAPLDTVTLLVRPERLRLSETAGLEAADTVVPGRIEKTAYNGNETHCWVRLTADVLWRVRVPNGSERKPFEPGQSVYVRWDAADGVVLPE